MLKLTAIMLGILLLTVSVTIAMDVDHSAYGMKATKKGVRHHTAHFIGNKVCGADLCEGSAYVRQVR